MKTQKGKGFLLCAVFLVLLLISNAAAATQKIKLVEILGKVEVKKAGTHKWKFGRIDQSLSNNDMVRTNDESRAEIRYSDGSRVIVRENSQILLNQSYERNSRSTSKYVTAFFGAVYFVVQEAMPKTYNTRVYSPTAVVSVRGTSFGTTVDKKTGRTEVDVVNGTVLVRNILLNQEFFVKAGYKTQVELNKAPSKPRAMTKTDISKLAKWVSEKLIKDEQTKQARQSKRSAVMQSGKAEDKIVIVKLIDNSGFSSSWDISNGLTQMIADQLANATKAKIKVFEDASKDADEIGQTEKAKYVISGEITSLELSKHAAISIAADQYNEYYKAKICILLHITDPSSGALVKKIRVQEIVKGDNIPENDLKVVTKNKFDLNDAKFKKSIIGKAIKNTLQKIETEANLYL